MQHHFNHCLHDLFHSLVVVVTGNVSQGINCSLSQPKKNQVWQNQKRAGRKGMSLKESLWTIFESRSLMKTSSSSSRSTSSIMAASSMALLKLLRMGVMLMGLRVVVEVLGRVTFNFDLRLLPWEDFSV